MAMDRRTFLRGGAIAAGGLIAGVAPRGVWAQTADPDGEPVKVYIVVVDGLRPDELGMMPHLTQLAAEGRFYPDGRADMVAETTPNHVSILTGMRPDRHGMPGNSVPGRAEFNPRVGDNPRYLRADSLFTLLRRQAPDLKTASVTSKVYLEHMSFHDRTGDGQADATHVYEPSLYIPVSEHETDWIVIQEAMRVSREMDPDFLFVNLGDVDRVGHTDFSGSAEQLALWRRQTLVATDTLIRMFVEQMKSEDKWEWTVFMVTADHNMDWSRPDRIINIHPEFQDDDLLRDEVLIGVNGGAALYSLRSPAEPRAAERLLRMREIAVGTDGVEEALFTGPRPPAGGEAHWVRNVHPHWGLTGDLTGDMIVIAEAGWRVTETGQTSNPIPGNHGHSVTLPIPVIIAGGYPGLSAGTVEPAGALYTDEDPGQARNIDLAPTTAWLLGLHAPPGDFDGRVLTEAFTARPPARVTADNVVPMPRMPRLDGQTRTHTAVMVSERVFAGGADAVVIASAGDFPDALAGTPLAVAAGAPLLLAGPDGLDEVTRAEVERLDPDEAYVLGGEAVLGAGVEADLVEAGVPEDAIRRIGGENRYDTARLVAAELGAANGEAVLASGESFADALAAGPGAAAAGRPILLTRQGSLPQETLQAIEDAGITRITIAGGPSVVSTAIEDALREAGVVVERLGGADRYATARLFAERAIREGALTDRLWLVSGANFPDALAAGAAAAARVAPADGDGEGGDDPFWMASGAAEAAPSTLLLVPPDGLRGAAGELILRRADEFIELVVVGGTAAISTATTRDVTDVIRRRRSR
jgi:ectonucleotide pyrophosphatase/phosphodiesterase family member 5